MVGRRISLGVWAGYGLAFIGLVVLVEGVAMGNGEFLSLGCSVIFSFQILALDRFGKGIDGNRITPVLFGVNGVLSLLLVVALCFLGGPWTYGKSGCGFA